MIISGQCHHIQCLIRIGYYDLLSDLDSGVFDILDRSLSKGYQAVDKYGWIKRDFEMIFIYGECDRDGSID